jgi:tRNA G10  N-methylase Trm11
MNIAFFTGRTPELANKEIEAAATILPFPWISSIVQPGVFVLKPAEGSESLSLGKDGYPSPENENVFTELESLQRRLGGTIKIALLWEAVEQSKLHDSLLAFLKGLHESSDEGKVVFGISTYGKNYSTFREGLALKKALRQAGISSRIVETKDGEELSSAQILGNNLVNKERPRRVEIVLVQDGSKWWIGRTVTIQDIASYRKRDFEIPYPDPASGMLSPKLAQTMVNLAVGKADSEVVIYDPFCGNGRIVEEVRLMGMKAYGSDVAERKIVASRLNMQWMATEYDLVLEKPAAELFWVQDATGLNAPETIAPLIEGKDWHIVSEPYLGRPLREPLTKKEASDWLHELKTLYERFFKTWSAANARPKSFLIVFPAAKVQGGGYDASVYATLVDRLAELGYSSMQMSDYGRPDALVKRQLVRVTYSPL